MRVSAKADYAIRAAVELAATDPAVPLKAERIAHAQDIPTKFLEAILLELKHADVVRSQRGPDGGYSLARPAGDISLADVIRAVDGPLANVRGDRPEGTSYRGVAKPLTTVWIAVRAALRQVLEETTLADLVSGALPDNVRALADEPEAWLSLGRVRGPGRSAAVSGGGRTPGRTAAVSGGGRTPGRTAGVSGGGRTPGRGPGGG